MARRITNEDLVLNLILNADQVKDGSIKARGELYKLDRETRDLQLDLDKLKLREKELTKDFGKNSKQVKANRKQMNALEDQIELNYIKMRKLRKEVGLAGMTINQMNSHLAALRIQMNNATDPTVLKKLRRDIKLTEMRIERMRTGMSRAAQAWRRMGTAANQFGTVISWMAIAVFGLTRAINGTIKNMRQLDSQFSSVMKTTDLTRGEVAKLKQEFDQLNEDEGTRTPTKTKELLEIARIAGRLGIRGVEDIRNFTLAVDKLYVALGDDLEGSVEEITEQVGKLVNVFRLAGEEGLTQSEALLRVGSVLNELGKSSEASAKNILNFTTRMGGVGSMAGFTIDQLAGIAAALDATGVKVERGATAVIKIINGLGENVEKFSRILGISVEEYAKWAEEDVNGLLMAMLEATSSGKASILEVTKSMGDMEVSGVRVAEVFGKLTQNLEKVKDQQLIAARAFESSASVMNEFYIITKDWDSLMALQGKRLKSLADDYSKAMTPAMYKAYRGLIDFLFALKDVAVWLGRNSKLFGILTGAIIAFKATRIARTINNIIISTRLWAGDLARTTKAAWANSVAVTNMKAAYVSAGGGIKGATRALKALWLTMWSNPLTAIIGLVGAAAAAFFLFSKKVSAVNRAIGDLNVEVSTQTRKMKALFEAAKKTAEGTEERAHAIEMINKVYGQYLDDIVTEKDSVDDLNTAYETAIKNLREQIALKFKNDRYDKLMSDAAEDRRKKQERMLGGIRKRDGGFAFGQAMFETDQLLDRLANMPNPTARAVVISNFLKKWNIENQASRKAFLELIELRRDEIAMEKELDESIKGYLSVTDPDNITKDEDEDKTPGPMLDEEAYKAAKAAAEMARDEQKLTLMQMGLDKEEYRKRELKLEEEYLRKMLELTRQRYTSKEGDPIGGAKEILDAQIALQQNLNAQVEDGGKKRVETQKDEMLAMEVQLLEMLENKKITQSQFDSLMLQMQEDYYARMIAKLRGEGESTLDLEKKWYENRLKQQQEFQKQQKILREAMTFAYDLPEEEGDEWIGNWAEQYRKRRDRIRQFLQLETGDNEGLESQFAVFEQNDFQGQLEQLKEWYENKRIMREEYERLETEIIREQNRARMKIGQQMLGAVSNLLSAQSNLYAARKDAELKKAGDNEAKKLAIQKKYAEKEQNIAVAQALISGAMSIMRIWEAKATGNAIADAIIKGVLTAAMVATTATQVAAIKAQQFAKGSYPVTGADDGRTYNAEYVGTPKTGVYKKPSLGLFAEKPEMVIDYPTLRNIQFNNPALIDAIMAQKTGRGQSAERKGQKEIPQYADGRWPDTGVGVSNSDMATLIRENTKAMQEIKNLKVVAAIETIEREREKYVKIKQTTGL